MEVHHHSHHPLKWKEYISEFLKNIHLDLERDIKEIDNVLSFNIQKQPFLFLIPSWQKSLIS
jgi:hypothetical protein